MAGEKPNYTIHLGDIYYVGDSAELDQHCLGKETDPKYIPVRLLAGTDGSFALTGNHEMYALGEAYFTQFLPTLGPRDPTTGNLIGQEASFFCLRNKYWTVIGLDTGYYSTGLSSVLSWMSRIKFIKWFRKASWDKPSCRVPDEVMKWLPSTLAPDRNGRVPGVILLSHHQYYSGFDDWYVTPAEQLKPLLESRSVLWYWGHEHRMAVYDQFATSKGISAFGRCIGHGGMPVSRGARPDIKDCNCVLYDDRKYPNDENIDVGYNGYITMEFEEASLKVKYFDLNNSLLMTESWSTDESGIFTGPMFTNMTSDPGFIQNYAAYIQKHSAATGSRDSQGNMQAPAGNGASSVKR